MQICISRSELLFGEAYHGYHSDVRLLPLDTCEVWDSTSIGQQSVYSTGELRKRIVFLGHVASPDMQADEREGPNAAASPRSVQFTCRYSTFDGTVQ